jgi:hypothetical protein
MKQTPKFGFEDKARLAALQVGRTTMTKSGVRDKKG